MISTTVELGLTSPMFWFCRHWSIFGYNIGFNIVNFSWHGLLTHSRFKFVDAAAHIAHQTRQLRTSEKEEKNRCHDQELVTTTKHNFSL